MRSQFGRAILGGFVGTIMLTLMMMFVAPMIGVHMDIAKNLADMMGTGHAIGLAAHFMLGTIAFPAVYTFLLFRFLPGTPLVKGLIWGAALWQCLRLQSCRCLAWAFSVRTVPA
jgi:ACR3 family arsenite efflux pump ArsB